jgi:hypothetical protein
LLDTYQAERPPVAARVLQNTRAQTALWRVDDHTSALREVLGDLIGIDEVRLRLAGMITATDIRYPMEGTDDLLGWRIPDLDIGHGRVYELLHRARAVLLDLGGLPPLDAVVTGWADRVDLVRARPAEGCDLGADAVLIRPDGHVAWGTRAGERPDLDALRTALTTWLGPAGLHGAHVRHRPALRPTATSD